uniref:Uncharacterized protein n=1 Tax=Arundo donax TaxID=35708 RepID=A0A0A9G021_ARUDO
MLTSRSCSQQQR